MGSTSHLAILKALFPLSFADLLRLPSSFQAHREDVRLFYDGISDTQAALICLRIYVESWLYPKYIK
jgi:hypothetical protein